jgi:hypothetical protein
MSIGFIPSNDNHAHEAIEPCEPYEEWLARQAAEACELNTALKDAYHALLEDVRKYAVQLELITAVVLNSSCSETGQERLDALIAEARHLTLAVAEAKRQNIENAQPASARRHRALLRGSLLPALLWGVGIFMGVLIAHGGL